MDSGYLWVSGLNLANTVQCNTDSLPKSTGLLALLAKQSLIAKSLMEGPSPLVQAKWIGVRLHVCLLPPPFSSSLYWIGYGNQKYKQIQSKMLWYTDTPQQLLAFVKKWLMLCRELWWWKRRSTQYNRVNLGNGRFTGHRFEGVCHIPSSGYGWPRGTLEW